MRAADLVTEGIALLRPSLVLSGKPSPKPAIGVWGAPYEVEIGGFLLRHTISLDCAWLEAQGFPVSGVLSLFSDGLDAWVTLDPDAAFDLEPFGGGDPLWGVEEPSFPPAEALCLYGSEKVGAWLAKRGQSRKDGAEAVIYRTPEGAFFLRTWKNRFPLYREGPAAVLGGWPMMWPDDDEYAARGRLVLLTLRDAEPWIEVWADGEGRLSAVVRVT